MKSILILGLGLIGGSLAKAIKESGLEYRIYAYDPDQLSLENALNDKSIDEVVDQIETKPQIEDLSLIMTHEIEKIWSSIGSNIINMSLDDHERFLMFTSHLPHLIAYTTMLSIDDEVDISKFSAGGLKEFLRIAESNPDLWADIFSSNSKNLKVGSEIFINNLNKIIDLFKDPETLKELLAEIRNKKQKL